MKRKDEIPETVAIGLDVESLIGKDQKAIRELLDSEACALIVPKEGVPEGWPPEIIERDFNTEHGLHTFSWMMQLADGSWENYYSYGRPDKEKLDAVPALIYTRHPRETPEVLLRPIAEVALDEEGVCLNATAVNTEFLIRNRLQFAQARLDEPPIEKQVRPVARDPDSDAAYRLRCLLGLPTPTGVVDIRGVTYKPRAGPPRPWIPSCELKAFMFIDDRYQQRIVVMRESWEEVGICIIEDVGTVAPVAASPDGIRVSLKDGEDQEVLRFDIFSGDLDLRIGDGEGVLWQVILAGVGYSACAEKAEPSVFVLARRIESGPVSALLSFDRTEGRLRIRPEGRVIAEDLPAAIQESDEGIFIQAPLDLGETGGSCPGRD
jgi:hypothetical protein